MTRLIKARCVCLPLVLAVAGFLWACGGGQQAPSSPSPLLAASASGAGSVAMAGGAAGLGGAIRDVPTDVAFPPRNEPFDFRNRLELKYQGDLGRSLGPSYVDNEGAIVWCTEYLRYRLNNCNHQEATQKVMSQIDTGVIAPICQPVTLEAETPTAVTFPPRDQPFAFRQDLETKYRYGMGRSPIQTAVDNEGENVWSTEYLRYRLNYCTHLQAVDRVFLQVDGRGVQPDCSGNLRLDSSQFTIAPSVRTGFHYKAILVLGLNEANGAAGMTPTLVRFTFLKPSGATFYDIKWDSTNNIEGQWGAIPAGGSAQWTNSLEYSDNEPQLTVRWRLEFRDDNGVTHLLQGELTARATALYKAASGEVDADRPPRSVCSVR